MIVVIWLMMVNNNLVGGIPTPPKKKYDFDSWGYDIPNIWKTNVPNHQPDDGLRWL